MTIKLDKDFKQYYRKYGPHFTKELCAFVVSTMETKSGKISAFTKDVIEQKLAQQNVKLENNALYDAVFVANMCKADFLGRSVPDDDYHLCMYIKDVIDDPDGYEGQPFFRWLADAEVLGLDIDWKKFI